MFTPTLVYTVLVLLAALTAHTYRPRAASTIVNGAQWYELVSIRKILFLLRPRNIIFEARQKYKSNPFNLLNYAGVVTALPPEYADIVGNNKDLTLGEFLRKEFHTHLPAFAPIGQMHNADPIVVKVIKALTRKLGRQDFVDLVASQAVLNCDKALGLHNDWREIGIYGSVLDTIARVDVRVIWGETLGTNEDWVNVAKTYFPTAVIAALQLHVAPRVLRPFVRAISPQYRACLRTVEKIKNTVVPIVHERRSVMSQYDDALTWAEEESLTTDYDITGVHTALMTAAVHTSADVCTETLIQLAQREDIVCRLRKEIKSTIIAKGATRNALKSMELLDAVLKEVLRLKPPSTFTVERSAARDVQITPDLVVRKGEIIVIDMSHRLDPVQWPDPHSFDPDRFLRLRHQPAEGTKALFTSTSPEHLGLGYGLQACPGRFFVDMKLKFLLCHLILNYDLQLGPQSSTKPLSFGPMLVANPWTRLRYRRRVESMDLMKLS